MEPLVLLRSGSTIWATIPPRFDDNNKIHNLGTIKPRNWRIISLLENFYDVEHVIVLKNNEKILHLEFNDLDFKNKFEYYNSALNSSSIHI